MALRRIGRWVSAGLVLCLARAPVVAQNVAQWDFLGTLVSNDGSIEVLPQSSPPAGFPPVFDFVEFEIGGETAEGVSFERGTYFRVMGGFAPNGGGQYVNRYTIVMDVMFPDRSASGRWTALYNTNVDEPPANEAEAFIDPDGRIGTSGQYGGDIPDGEWHRLAIAIDLSAGTGTYYVDGQRVNQATGLGVDGRHSLWSIDHGFLEGFSLFGDEDEENSAGFISSLQFWDTTLAANQIAALGAVSADGIPTPEELDLRECFFREFAAEYDAGENKVVCTWARLPGDEGFRVLRAGTQLGGDLGAAVTSFEDTAPPVGGVDRTYTLQTLVGGAVERECSVTIDTFTCAGALACCADQSARSVALTWEPPANLGATGYSIVRGGTGVGSVAVDVGAFTDTDVPPGLQTYEIVATGVAGDPCAASPLRCQVLLVPAGDPRAPACRGEMAQWDFDGDLSASSGQADLEPIGYPDVPDAPGVEFLTDTIAGEEAQVASFTRGTAFVARHGLGPNGGGIYVNQYTLVMDVKFPEITDWVALYQTNNATVLADGNDGDWFINPDGFGIGISGNYGGRVEEDTWHRLALVYDTQAGTYTGYIDGREVQQNGGMTVDNRWTLYTRNDSTPYIILFADETPGATEMGAGLVGSVQLRDYPLSPGEVAGRGGPTPPGLPAGQPLGWPRGRTRCAPPGAPSGYV
ncbi:MAG: hypothetical protein O7J95_09785, partial [Planctomycetota bacterium]|nr:hypothetical protein [Planctomycetota bacterium]